MSLSSKFQRNILLAPYTTYKIGGPADYFFEANNSQELCNAITEARKSKLPFFLLGSGANILIGDKGFRGIVIHNKANDFTFNEKMLTAESGAIIADLIEKSAEKGLSGLEHFAGIPSTVGGALWQNLHFLSPDREQTVFISDVLVDATVLDTNGKTTQLKKEDMGFGYDESIFHHKAIIILESTFLLTTKPKEEIRRVIDANLAWRDEKQPHLDKYPSCGSVFKKIEGVGAGRLIDKAGLKGKRIGNAQIAEQHANFILNLGGAKAKDVRDLIDIIQQTVSENSGYNLETEIKFIGEF